MGLLNIILNRGSILEIVSCIISAAIVVFLVMPVHEYAHGFAAEKLGDPTPRWQGRMTLNPLKHVDYVGAVMIFLIGFGWAKPVQVDSRYFKKPKRDMAVTALAGPLSNIIFAFISALIRSVLLFIIIKSGHMFDYIAFISGQNHDSYWLVVLFIIVMIFEYVILINLSLAVFNMIPIPPLDGSKILYAVLPERIYWSIMRYEKYLYFALLILLFAGSGLSGVISRIVYSIANVLTDIAWLPFKYFI